MSLLTFLSEWAYPGPLRSIGTPHQQLYRKPETELERLINSDVSPVYVSVNPYDEDGEITCVDRLFFDFDNPTRVRDAWLDAVKLNESLARHYEAGALTVFSGCKGYHCYIYLQIPYKGSEAQCKAVYAELQDMILKGETYRTLDRGVIGDVKRLCRVPYSKHQKTGELCVPVDLDLKPYKLQQGFSRDLAEYGLSPKIVQRAHRNAFKPKPKIKQRNYTSNGKLRPCIEAVLSNGSVHDGPHLMRVAAIAEMLAEGYNEDQIIDRFSHLDGFDERKTTYYVRHAIRRGYRPFKCSTIQRYDACLGVKCSIYEEAS